MQRFAFSDAAALPEAFHKVMQSLLRLRSESVNFFGDSFDSIVANKVSLIFAPSTKDANKLLPIYTLTNFLPFSNKYIDDMALSFA